jgi:hypothetical protein
LLFNSVLVGPRPLHHFELGMRGKDLIVHAANPVAARSNLSVRHRKKISPKRDAKGLKHILRGIEGNAADQQQLITHVRAPALGLYRHV